mmetsp:Transcript_27981/g.51609  ORF Transcript_27981/g.51609 Transcript_27981/m.51609 type:complete len:230 (+) Transcript_27981:136-825(+)
MNHLRLFIMMSVVSSSMLFGGTTALISPHQSSTVAHRSYYTTGVMPTQTRSSHTTVGSGSAQHLPHPHPSFPLQRKSSTKLLLGPDNNNNNGGGANDMDPGLKLLVCILIDFIGVASFAAPGLGEATDIGWAPISAFLVQYLFGNGFITALALVEELSPGFDFIPTATIAWFLENANREDEFSPGAGGPPPSQSSGGASQSSTPSQSPSPRTRNSKPADSDVIDVDILD